MQLTFILLVALSLISSSSFTAANSEPNPGSIDSCGTVNVPLKYGNKNFGTVNQCLCQSQIPSFVDTNPSCQNAVKYAGRSAVIATLNQGCQGSSNHKQCHYPPNSEPQCSGNNPCGFTCINGYTPFPFINPTTCICSWPNSVCNGKCGFYLSCHSGLSKRRQSGWDVRHGCKPGWQACGVFGGSRRAWECVDVRSDLESCGGCMYPLHSESPTGTDCSDLVGVSDVGCVQGSCAVSRCRSGYSLSPEGTSCVLDAQSYNRTSHAINHNLRIQYAQAGLTSS